MVGLVGLTSAARLGTRMQAAKRLSVMLCIVSFCGVLDGWRHPASALLVGPGDSVEVTFFFASPPDVGGEVIDFLALTTTSFSSSGPGIAINAQLFDGAALLGSGNRPSAAFISFSDGLFGNAVAASLGSLTDSGFQGRILFTPLFVDAGDFINFDVDNFNVRAGHGSVGSVLLQQDGATITSVSIPTVETPIPAAALLFFSALAVLGIVVFRRKRGESAEAAT